MLRADGGSVLVRNVSILSPQYTSMYLRIRLCCHHSECLKYRILDKTCRLSVI
jgi:hypothetical protein